MAGGGRPPGRRTANRPAAATGRRGGHAAGPIQQRQRAHPFSAHILFCSFSRSLFGKALVLATGSHELTAMASAQQVRTIDLPAHRGAHP